MVTLMSIVFTLVDVIMIVMKFGGTSVQDAAALTNAGEIVRGGASQPLVVVASACAGVTNALLEIARGARDGGSTHPLDAVEQLRQRHRKIAHELFSGEVLYTVQSQVDALLDELRDLVRSIVILGELTNRSLDTFASFGEKLSTLLLFHHLHHIGVNAVLLDVREIIITDDEFTQAAPLFDEIDKRAEAIITPQLNSGHVVVTQGFLGATATGIPTTIGRGGSDYSAAILGAALNAEEIQIWTDVDGVMTCDPSVIPGARLIEEMTFREAAELAYFGAKVLHPSTILPAVKKNIPVRVLNSRKPGGGGTVIVRESRLQDTSPAKAIAFKRGITLLNIDSTRMLMTHGFLARVFDVFARYRKSVDVIATSEVSISLTIDSDKDLDLLTNALKEVAEVQVTPRKAIFCVIGENLKTSKGTMGRIFSALDGNDVRVSMVSLGASEINVTFVVDEKEVETTAKLLHAEFFGQESI